MRKIYFAAVAAAIFMANVENVNAQTATAAEQVNNQELVDRLAKKAEVRLKSEVPSLIETPTSLASQRTYYYNNVDLRVASSLEYKEKLDSLLMKWEEAKRRVPVSGIAAGPVVGAMQMAENFSPVAGAQLTMAWKRVEISGGGLVGISKYNKESNKAGKSFVCPIAFAELGYIPCRFSMNGYDNQGYISFGAGVQYVFDKNANDAGTNTYETETQIVTEKSEFMVEGNSTSLYLYGKGRFSLRHMGGSAISVKIFGGIYNRYYMEGSRRKAIVGATVAWEFSGAKKTVDSDVVKLRKSLEGGNYELINDVINQIRAERMK